MNCKLTDSDIWAAFCAQTETMLPTDKWFNHPEKVLQSICKDTDQHAHIATWLLGRVNNCIHSSDAGMDPENLILLQTDLEKWTIIGQNATRPIIHLECQPHADNPFSSILFSSTICAIARILWLTARILLLDHNQNLAGISHRTTELHEQASEVCGIIETYKNSSTVLVEAIHPLWICSKHLKTRSEKFVVLELLGRVERLIGWKTSWRAVILRERWGLG